MENQLFQYCPPMKDNTRTIILLLIMSILGLELGYTVKYILSQWEIPWIAPSGFPLCSSYVSPCIPRLVIIKIESYLGGGREPHFFVLTLIQPNYWDKLTSHRNNLFRRESVPCLGGNRGKGRMI